MFTGLAQHMGRFAFCALGPLLIVLSSRWLFDTVINCKAIEFAPKINADFVQAMPAGFVAAQYAWGMALVILTIAFLTAAAWLTFAILDELEESRRAAGAILIAIGIVAVGLTAWALYVPPSFDNCVSDKLLKPSLKGLLIADGQTTFLSTVKSFVVAQRVGAIVVTLLLIAATSALTRPISATGDDAIREVAWRIDRVKKLLYVGAAVLVAGIVSFITTYDLPTGLLEGDKYLVAQAKELARGPLIFWGLTLTLILLANYAPATFFLNRQANRLAHELGHKTTPKDTEAWVQENNLALSVREQSKRFLTMASPLLAAFLPAVMQTFAKAFG